MLSSAVSGSKCKKFVCKSFNAGPADTCVFVNTTVTDQLVRKCDKKTCTAIAWGSVQAATTNATCMAVAPVEIKNMTVPGDLCTNKVECFGLDTEVSCSTVCKTTRADGGWCVGAGPVADSRWCPAGSYCDSGANKCTAQKAAGVVCATNDECTTGLTCIKAGTATTFTCSKYWSLDAGTKFDASHAAARGPLLPVVAACKSHWAIKTSDAPLTYECRRAPQNQNPNDLSTLKKTDGDGATCPYAAYDDATDATKLVNKTGTSACGFNKDDAGYCDKQIGDKWFNATLNDMQKTKYDTLVCHVRSTLYNCSAATSIFTPKMIKSYLREYISTPEGKGAPDATGYALYANNDKCVAQSITLAYWQGDSPNFGFSTLTMTSFAGIILTISALFYIF